MNYDVKQELKNAFNDLKSPKTFKNQIPNLLTASRLIAPLVIVPLAITGNLVGATIAVAATALTDGLDGFFARKLHVTSKLGADLDAFSDKIFTLGITLPIIAFKPVLALTLGLEGTIAAINMNAKNKGADPKSSIIGKVKTVMLCGLLGASYLSLNVSLPSFIIPSLLVSTTLLQTGAAIGYAKSSKEKINKLKENEVKEEIIEEIIENDKDKKIEMLKSLKFNLQSNLNNEKNKEEVVEKEKVKIRKKN